MSLKKSATRRVGLLASSSLIAASLVTFGGLTLAPSAVMAQATCTSPAAPTGNGTTAVTIAAGTYNPGITCSYAGTGSTITTAGAVTVSSTAGGNGINLSATGAGAVNWVSSAGTLAGGANTNGPVIDATSVSGAINITAAMVTANQAGTTHGIRATSAGSGAITIISSTGLNNNVAGGEAAIEAVTSGGNIGITTAGGFTQGRLRGILARTSGAGSVTLNLGSRVTASNIDGVAAVDVTAGTGGVSITATSASIGTLANGTGFAIRVATTGSAIVNNTGSTIGFATSGLPGGGGAVDFSGVANGVTFSHGGATGTTGRWLASGASVFSAGNDTLNMTGIGQNATTEGASIDFGAGNDTFNLASFFSLGAFSSPNLSTIDFGSGTDTFNLSGAFVVNGTTISNLEALNNSGVIYMGVGRTGDQNLTIAWNKTDDVANDRLSLPGTTFTGSGNSRIVMDVDIGGGVQEGCDTMTGVADCLDLRVGATAGATLVTVNNLGDESLQAGYDLVGVTLVDVGGGASGAGHFVLDPDMGGIRADALYGNVIGRPGLFSIALRYDAETQRHVLVGLPKGEVMEYAMLSGAAQSIWHMTSETVTDRQTELREGASGGSVWMRASGEYTRRDTSASFAGRGETFSVDNSYKLYAGTVMGGIDLISGSGGGYDYVLGGQIGYIGSSFGLNESETTGRFTGATGGVYASLWSDSFFLDGAFNANGLTLDHDSPGLASKTNTYLNSLGGHAEGGLRIALGERAFVEPLITVAYVRTSFEEISLNGGEIIPADAESLRAALGARLGATLGGGGVNASWFLAGRAWNEFEGASDGIVANPGADLPFSDEFSGGFGEAEAGINLFNDSGTLSGFLTTGVKAKSGYSAVNLALGVRMAW